MMERKALNLDGRRIPGAPWRAGEGPPYFAQPSVTGCNAKACAGPG